MNKESLNYAFKELERQRYINEVKREKRIETVKREIPEIAVLLDNLAETEKKITVAFFSKENIGEKINKIMNENLKTQKRITDLLVLNGYAENYIDTNYNCELCCDNGYANGKMCDCVKKIAVKYEGEHFYNSIPMSNIDFDNFSLDYYDNNEKEIMKSIFEFCKVYTTGFNKHSPSILMMGGTGLGKTHLSVSIVSSLIERGFSVLYSASQDLFRTLQNEYYGRGEDGKDTMNIIENIDLLVIDDLGMELNNDFNYSTIYNIINKRMNLGKPVILNTNLTTRDFEARYGERIASRVLTTYKCLKFVGRDIRCQKLYNKK